MDFPAFLAAQTREIYEQWAGLSRTDGLAALEQRCIALAAPAHLRQDEAEISGGDPASARRARLRYAERLSLALSLAARDERAAARRALGGDVEVEGGSVGLRALPALISAEHDPSRRRSLQHRYEGALAAANPALRALWLGLDAACLSLSCRPYHRLMADAKDIDIAELTALATDLLEATDRVFQERKAIWARRLALDPHTMDRFDTSTLFRGAPWDGAFQPHRILDIADAVLGLFGRRGSSFLRFDLDSRPRKTARPFLAPLQVPQELVLVARPSGGHRDAEALLHELGHALCFLEIPASRAWEDRLLWSDGVAEVGAYLIAGLLRDPGFLAAHCGFSDAAAGDYAAYAAFLELWMVRRYAARVIHEFAWHATGCRSEGAGYSGWQARALGIETRDLYFLAELDEGLYAAEYLQAWLLEAELHGVLVGNWGLGWWRDGRAVAFLKGLWSLGGQLSRPGLLSRLGVARMSIDAVVARLAD